MTALAVLASASCANDEPGSTEPVTCTSEGPTAGEPTAPGILLCVGTAGYVPLTDRSDRHHVVRVTVTAVDRVSRAEVEFLTAQDLGTGVDPADIDVYGGNSVSWSLRDDVAR